MHENDRQQKAHHLGLSLKEFDELLSSANHAYKVLRDLGPFYGKAHVKEPTFRTTALPVGLPRSFKKMITQFGEDALGLGKALPLLPETYKKKLGNGLDFKVPPTWRFDAIWDEKGGLNINEIEGVDGASALIIAEQIAYGLVPLESSSAAVLAATYQKGYFKSSSGKIMLILRANYPHKMNSVQFIKLLDTLSKGKVKLDIIEEDELREKKKIPRWDSYDGVINESTLFLEELEELGMSKDKLIAAGNYNALMNKGVFALVFDSALKKFWTKEIGADCLTRLQEAMIPTRFIETEKDLVQAKKKGDVIKIYWAPTDRVVINRSFGVAMPEGDEKHSGEARWKELQERMSLGYKIIAQEYIRPKQIVSYLRKKGTNLEKVQWYNRICAKYVCTDNPNKKALSPVAMTGVEVTLGPEVVPASRECAFTAGYFAEDELVVRPQLLPDGPQFLRLPEE